MQRAMIICTVRNSYKMLFFFLLQPFTTQAVYILHVEYLIANNLERREHRYIPFYLYFSNM